MPWTFSFLVLSFKVWVWMGSYLLLTFSVLDIFKFQKSVWAVFGRFPILSYSQATATKAMALTIGSLPSGTRCGVSSEGVMMLCPILPWPACDTTFSCRPTKSSCQYLCSRMMPRLGLINNFIFLVWYLTLNLHEGVGTFYFFAKVSFLHLYFSSPLIPFHTRVLEIEFDCHSIGGSPFTH